MRLSRAFVCLTLVTGCTSPANVDPDAGGAPDSAVTPDASTTLDAASAPSTTCVVDTDALTLSCVRWDDPFPEYVDDETRTEVRISFAAGAFDGATRTIAGEADHVVTELTGDGETFDESMTSGLTPNASNDALVTDVLVWYRVHLLASPKIYERVDATGTVRVDASGHGHLEVSWTDPPSGYGLADELSADF